MGAKALLPNFEIVKLLSTAVCRLHLFAVQSDNPFERCIIYAISMGGDTDTIASMAGAISGALYGISYIPESWRNMCESSEKTLVLAENLFMGSKSAVGNAANSGSTDGIIWFFCVFEPAARKTDFKDDQFCSDGIISYHWLYFVGVGDTHSLSDSLGSSIFLHRVDIFLYQTWVTDDQKNGCTICQRRVIGFTMQHLDYVNVKYVWWKIFREKYWTVVPATPKYFWKKRTIFPQ